MCIHSMPVYMYNNYTIVLINDGRQKSVSLAKTVSVSLSHS